MMRTHPKNFFSRSNTKLLNPRRCETMGIFCTKTGTPELNQPPLYYAFFISEALGGYWVGVG